MAFECIDYASLNPRQKETYNFQKVASELADYGYACLMLNDDWQGADFLAVHINGTDMLRVQLKSRFGIYKKYGGKGLHIAFRAKASGHIYVYPHDELMNAVLDSGRVLDTLSWKDTGGYDWPTPPAWALNMLEPYKV